MSLLTEKFLALTCALNLDEWIAEFLELLISCEIYEYLKLLNC